MRVFFFLSPNSSQILPPSPNHNPLVLMRNFSGVRMKTHQLSISNAPIFEEEMQETKGRYQLGGEGGPKTLC